MKERLLGYARTADGYQREHRWAGVPFAVIRKFSEDQASNLAALIAYYAFFSIFPLLLAGTTILGYVLQGNPGLQKSISGSWISQFPIVGDSISKGGSSLNGNALALVVGLGLALWSGFAVARMAQTAFNSIYDVPMNDRPNFVQKTIRSAGLIATIGGGLVISTFVAGIATGSSSFSIIDLGIAGKIAAAVLTIVIDVAIFILAFNWLTVRDLEWRRSLPGATFAGVGWFVLQQATTYIINHKIQGSQGTYGQFAAVIALLTWFYLASQVVILGAELNVVLNNKLWPRAVLDRPQTEADYRALERYAEEQKYEDPQAVDTAYPTPERQRERDQAVETERTIRHRRRR